MLYVVVFIIGMVLIATQRGLLMTLGAVLAIGSAVAIGVSVFCPFYPCWCW